MQSSLRSNVIPFVSVSLFVAGPNAPTVDNEKKLECRDTFTRSTSLYSSKDDDRGVAIEGLVVVVMLDCASTALSESLASRGEDGRERF